MKVTDINNLQPNSQQPLQNIKKKFTWYTKHKKTSYHGNVAQGLNHAAHRSFDHKQQILYYFQEALCSI